MKKILIVLGSLALLFVAAMIILPMVVDVDHYRPQIVKLAGEKLNGKLELGKLELSLWGSIHVEIGGLELSDAKNVKIISVKDAFVAIPWSSIFGGSPLLTFSMKNPEVRVLKDINGKMNILNLMRTTPGGTPDAAPGTAGGAPSAPGETKLPGVLANSRLGVDIQNALFYYKDEATKSETVTKNLNLRIKDLSLSRKTEVEISGLFESSAEKLFKVAGPFKIKLNADPRMEAGEFKGVTADLDANFDDLEIRAASAFYKKKGMNTDVKAALEITKDQLTISKFVAKFFNAEISVSGIVKGIQAEPTLELAVKSNSISLAAWNELIPMLKDYSLSGSASFDAKASGPVAKIQYAADLAVKDLKAKAPMLKAEPTVNLSLKITTDKVERLLATMKAPGNDLTIDGSIVSLTQPKIDLKVTSPGMDLDQLVKFPPVGAESSSGKAGVAGQAAGSGGADKPASAEDLDALLDPLRKNEIARDTTLIALVNLKTVQVYGVKMSDLNTKLSMRNLVASVDSAYVKMWDGTVAMKAQTAMLPKTPTYTFSSTVAGLDMQKAVTSQFQLFKNTVLGKVNLKIEGNGASYNPQSAKKNLNAKGSMKITDATFQSIDVAKMAGDAINKALEKVGDKIPAAKGKTVKALPGMSSKYDFIASDFTIARGHFIAPNFTAKAMKDQGLDLRGSTEVNLLDQELKAEWEIIDTYNLTKARDVGFEVSGVKVVNVLAEGSNPVVLPVSVACKYTAPCPSYGKVPEHFIKVAMGNVKKGAVQAVKTQGLDKAKEAGKKLLKGLFQ